MGLISAESRGVLVHQLMALANETKDEVIYHYAMVLANWDSRGKDAGEVLLGLIRALAENRRHMMDEMRKLYTRSIDPPIVVLTADAIKDIDLRAGGPITYVGGSYMTRGAMLDRTSAGELFHSLIRRLTQRLRSWYKGRWQ